MAPDEWTPLAVGFWRDPKVVGTTPAAKLLVLSSYTYAQAELTDGKVPRGALPIIAADAGVNASRKVVAELEQRGLWEPCDDGWRIPGWLRWNKPAEVVKTIREAKASAGMAGNHKRWHVNEGVKVLGCPLCYPTIHSGPASDPLAIAPAIGSAMGVGGEIEPGTGYETVTDAEDGDEIRVSNRHADGCDSVDGTTPQNGGLSSITAGQSVAGDRRRIAPAIGAANPIGYPPDRPEESPPSHTPTPTATSRSASVAGHPQPANDEAAQRIEPDHPTAQAALADMRAAVDRAINGDEPDDQTGGDIVVGPWPL